MLVSSVLNRLKKLEDKKLNGIRLKLFFHNPSQEELDILDSNTEVYIFLEDGIQD